MWISWPRAAFDVAIEKTHTILTAARSIASALVSTDYARFSKVWLDLYQM